MYLVLISITFIVTIFSGILIKTKRGEGVYKYNYWACTIGPIIMYSLTYGLREGWGIDYNTYKNAYLLIGIFREFDDPLFMFINTILRCFEMPYYMAFVTYSFIIIVGLFVLLKQYREIFIYAVPLFYILSTQSTNLVRFYVGIAFIFSSIPFLLKNKWFWFTVSFFCGCMVHFSIILFLPFLLLFKFFDLFKNIYVILGLYFFSFLINQAILGSFIMEGISFIPQAYIYHNYVDNAEVWFSGDVLSAPADSYLNSNLLYRVRMFVMEVIILFLGFKIKDKYKSVQFYFFYSMMVIGFLMRRMVIGFEIPSRFIGIFYLFAFIVIAFIIYDVKKYRGKGIWLYLIGYPVIELIYRFFMIIINDLDRYLYIWDF